MSKTIGFILLVVIGLWLARDQIKTEFFKPRREVSRVEMEKTMSEKEIEVVATDLEVPWEIGWLPSGEMLVTERPGRLLMIGENRQVIEIEGVEHVGEGGLLGLAIHPKFEENGYIYLYLTSKENGKLVNRVERYRLVDNQLREKEIIVSGILGAAYHDGGRLEFGPDGKLYVTTGDAGKPELAQDQKSLNGKVLRVEDDGSVEVYSLGHRNPQGLAWDSQGRLWITEHGPSGVRTGQDEVNLVTKGGNYGWPEIVGQETKTGMKKAVVESGKKETWAPAGLEIVEDLIVFGGLRGEAVYVGEIVEEEIEDLSKEYFQEWGRVRAVRLGPDGWLYLSTSNRDGRGKVRVGDDQIVKIRMVN